MLIQAASSSYCLAFFNIMHNIKNEPVAIIYVQILLYQDGFFLVPAGEPRNITASLLSSTSFFLEWDPPLEEDRNGVITKYQIKVEWNVNQVHQLETVFVNNYVVTGLEPNTRYYYSVAAYTKVGMGPYSNKTAVTTKMQSTIPYSDMTDTTTAIEKEPLANMTDAATGSQSTHDRIVFSYCVVTAYSLHS